MAIRPIRLAALYVASGNYVAWRHPRSESQLARSSFVQFAQVAERGRLDFVLHGEGSTLAERDGRPITWNITGSLDLTLAHAMLTRYTRRVGLVTTKSSTFNHPAHLAHELASLDLVSGGRAGWNLVTAARGIGATNFRVGRAVGLEDRYRHAADVLQAINSYWTSSTGAPPPSPQGRPVQVQAGKSPEGMQFAAEHADAVFSVYGSQAEGIAAQRDYARRMAAVGRHRAELAVLMGVAFVIGRDADDVRAKVDQFDRLLTSDPVARDVLEPVWGALPADFDFDGPLPAAEPDWDTARLALGTIVVAGEPLRELIEDWRQRAARQRLSARQVAAKIGTRLTFAGTPVEIADQMEDWVDAGAVDGFVLTPKLMPGQLAEFVDTVVPELQRRGRLRTEYETSTLRGHLGLDVPAAALPTAVGAA